MSPARIEVPSPIEKPYVLVVEGKDEQLFFEALIRHLGLGDIEVRPVGGRTLLRRNLPALVRTPGFSEKVTSLGVVRDTDSDPQAAFTSVQDALRTANLPVPSRPLAFSRSIPRVAVMLLPDADTSGMLEDLCLQAVGTDRASRCVDQYFDCLVRVQQSLPRNLPKARIQVFLASRDEAGKRLGEAAQAGYLPWGSPVFDDLKRFLQDLTR